MFKNFNERYKYYSRGDGLWNYLWLRFRIWRMKQKHGPYKKDKLTIKEYENFKVNKKDLEAVNKMSNRNVHFDDVQNPRVIPIIFRNKK